MTDRFTTPATLVRRTKDGRPYVYDPEKGKEAPYTRVTTFIDCLEDKFALSLWSQRMALIGVRDNNDIGRRLMSLPPVRPLSDDPTHEEMESRSAALDAEKRLLNGILTDAKEAAGYKDAANLGTLLHELTEAADDGRTLPVGTGQTLRDDVSAYSDALTKHRLRPVEAEVFVVNDAVKAAGTFDRIYEWTRPDGEVLRVIGDLKTGRVDYGQGKLSMQLALYANSLRYDPDAPELRGSLDVSTEVGLIVHLPAGQADCRVHEVDLTAGWDGVLLADQVREWRRRSRSGMLRDLGLAP